MTSQLDTSRHQHNRAVAEHGFKITNQYGKKIQNIAEKYQPEKRKNNKYVMGVMGFAKIDNMPRADQIAKADRMKKMVNQEGSRRYWKKDSLNIDDINQKSNSKDRKANGYSSLHTADIEGTKPNLINKNFNHIKNYDYEVKEIAKKSALDVKDINNQNKYAGESFKTKRSTDPLNPSYDVPTASGRHVRKIGPVSGNRQIIKHTVSPENIAAHDEYHFTRQKCIPNKPYLNHGHASQLTKETKDHGIAMKDYLQGAPSFSVPRNRPPIATPLKISYSPDEMIHPSIDRRQQRLMARQQIFDQIKNQTVGTPLKSQIQEAQWQPTQPQPYKDQSAQSAILNELKEQHVRPKFDSSQFLKPPVHSRQSAYISSMTEKKEAASNRSSMISRAVAHDIQNQIPPTGHSNGSPPLESRRSQVMPPTTGHSIHSNAIIQIDQSSRRRNNQQMIFNSAAVAPPSRGNSKRLDLQILQQQRKEGTNQLNPITGLPQASNQNDRARRLVNQGLLQQSVEIKRNNQIDGNRAFPSTMNQKIIPETSAHSYGSFTQFDKINAIQKQAFEVKQGRAEGLSNSLVFNRPISQLNLKL